MTTLRILSPLAGMLLLAAASGSAADPPSEPPSTVEKIPVTMENIVEVLEKGLAPFRKHDILIDNVEDPLVVRKALPVCHLIFVRTFSYRETVRKPEGTRPRTKVVQNREYADFAMVPKGPLFHLKNALTLSKEETQVNGPFENVMFRKYGLHWRSVPSKFRQYTLYLGEDAYHYYFGNANLSVLSWFQRAFALRNGFNAPEVLADALNSRDTEEFTARYAVVELARYKNEALPELRKSIQNAVELDEPPYPHFACMKLIDTPEADAMLNSYARSKDDVLLTGLFRAFADSDDFRISQKEVFLRMMDTRRAPLIALRAAKKLNIEQEFLPALRRYVVRPFSFDDYSLGVTRTFEILHPGVQSPLNAAKTQILLLLLRSGDTPNSLQLYDLKESHAEREERLAKQDAERVKPYVDTIVNSPYRESAMLTALELAAFTTNKERVSPTYVKRVRRTGAEILTEFPPEDVAQVFQNLLQNVVNDREHDLLDEAYRLYSRAGRSRAGRERTSR